MTNTYSWLKPAIFGAVFGAIVVTILGFSQFGWMLTSKAQGIANDRAQTAVAEALAPVCAARFFGQPDATAKLADLKKLPEDYEQRDYVEKGGWAVTAGSISPDYQLASACARKIIAGKPA